MKTLTTAIALLALAGCSSATSDPAIGPAHGPDRVAIGVSATPSGDGVAVLSAPGRYEATIAISPVNPDNAVAAVVATTGNRTSDGFATFDGGRSWSAGAPMRVDAANGKTYSGHGDPVLAADREGRFYFASLMSQRDARQQLLLTTVSVMRSDDGGRTWTQPTVVTETVAGADAPFDDKEWMAVDDTGGAHDGNVYLVWQKLARRAVTPSVIYFARSVDRAETWSEPRALTEPALSGSSMIDVGAEGEIFLGYYRSAERAYLLRVSRDGGESFTPPLRITEPAAVGGPITGTALSQRGFPMLVADRSTGPHRGRLYFVGLAAATLQSGRRTTAIGVWRSGDGGQTWSGPSVASAPTTGDAFFPMAAVDQTNGDLVVAWYDRRDNPDTGNARIYITRSIDGGVTFEMPRALTPQFPIDAPWLGDYYGIAARAGRAIVTFSPASGEMSAVATRFGGRGETKRRRPVRH